MKKKTSSMSKYVNKEVPAKFHLIVKEGGVSVLV
jgi:hypothetical protein